VSLPGSAAEAEPASSRARRANERRRQAPPRYRCRFGKRTPSRLGKRSRANMAREMAVGPYVESAFLRVPLDERLPAPLAAVLPVSSASRWRVRVKSPLRGCPVTPSQESDSAMRAMQCCELFEWSTSIPLRCFVSAIVFLSSLFFPHSFILSFYRSALVA
jgi:hypothetical protein